MNALHSMDILVALITDDFCENPSGFNQLQCQGFLKGSRNGIDYEGLESYLLRTTGKTYGIEKRLEEMREEKI